MRKIRLLKDIPEWKGDKIIDVDTRDFLSLWGLNKMIEEGYAEYVSDSLLEQIMDINDIQLINEDHSGFPKEYRGIHLTRSSAEKILAKVKERFDAARKEWSEDSPDLGFGDYMRKKLFGEQ